MPLQVIAICSARYTILWLENGLPKSTMSKPTFPLILPQNHPNSTVEGLKICHKDGKRLLIRTVLALIENCYLLNFNK
jgi:hypothetical protein